MMAATCISEPAGTRVNTLGMLATMAALSTIDAKKFWANREVRRKLLACCAVGQPSDVRTPALSALWSFSACDHVQERMWSDEVVRETLLSCAAANLYLDAEEGPKPQVHDVRS